MAPADKLDGLLCIMNGSVFNEKAQEKNLITGLIRGLQFPRSEQQRCLNHFPVRSVL
jgi:hypothetical protein